jgi:hypothetical protein
MKNILRIINSNKNFKPIKNWAKQFYANCSTEIRLYKSRKALQNLSVITKKYKNRRSGNILIDGTFLNLGYFYRLQLARASLADQGFNEVAFLGRHNRKHCFAALKVLGLKTFSKINLNKVDKHRNKAKTLVGKVTTSKEFLATRLPLGYPASFVYDDILKRQKRATPDFNHPSTLEVLEETLAYIKYAKKLLNLYKPRWLLMSHAITMERGPLVWAALQKKVPVLLLFGNYGTPRFFKMTTLATFFSLGRPEKKDMALLPPEQKDKLRKTGSSYLNRRLKGLSNDIGGQYAFSPKKRQNANNSLFNFAQRKPVIAVYASNWFDFPHALGMKHFTDFYDWITLTYKIAMKADHVNWVFRPHPCDDWYGGTSLRHVLPPHMPRHISLLPMGIPGNTIQEIADGLVTFHGTAGIEYAAAGKPVLLAEKSWYHDMEFSVCAKSRTDYIRLLQKKWWLGIDKVKTQNSALEFAGMYFCAPHWQKPILMPDDSDRKGLVNTLGKKNFESNRSIIKEVNLLNEWLSSKNDWYHSYKIKNSHRYILPF